MAASSGSASQFSSWARLLQSSRSCLETSDGSSSQSVLDEVEQYFPLLSQQFSSYGNALHLRRAGIESAYHENDPPAVDTDSLIPFHLHQELIVETRASLRYALSLFTAEESRGTIQRKGVLEYQWHRLLCYALSQPDGDVKCRVMSARLLSNLVTCNHSTASVLASDLLLSPSQENVTERVRKALSLTPNVQRSTTIPENSESATWVDMMIACSRAGSRDALGATVAALHNCLVALDDNPSLDRQAIHFASKIASDSMLVSTLLRQMLPSESVVTPGAASLESHADAATEWIVLTLEKLCSLGMISRVFMSAGGSIDGSASTLTPEQIVFLHCAAHAVDEATHPSSATRVAGTSLRLALGGEASDYAVVASLLFLARKFCDVSNMESAPQNPDEVSLFGSARTVLLEMLAGAFGSDSTPCLTEARLRIGTDTTLMPEVASQLTRLADALMLRNNGRSARELDFTPEEQRNLTGLVRLIGNLCFECRHNQDMMRMSVEGNGQQQQQQQQQQRTALHVLLSCTSLAYGCFTLREWAIVAIRSALDRNEENQKLVEELQAQQPVQSTSLQQMGVRVDLDATGKVRVVPGNDDN